MENFQEHVRQHSPSLSSHYQKRKGLLEDWCPIKRRASLARNIRVARINSLMGVLSFVFILLILYTRDSAPCSEVTYVSLVRCFIYIKYQKIHLA